ncbi:MAG TPA: TAXI family TRAP transporter solute-binding subunit [Candidatus Sulfotelmatobacter sp.]|nr:TAXI family TRAP transporter solute-binding subunit [Candidatus Sulfotelmatobacter sp.]
MLKQGRALLVAAGLAALLTGNSAFAGEPASPASSPSRSHVIAVGSGEVGGAYYPEAGAVCRMVNRDRAQHGVHCLVEATSGSAANLAALRSGDLQLALVQSHTLADAIAGKGAFAKDGPNADLRSLLSLHGEPVAVLLGANAKIKTPADLKGKRINLGHPGSYQRLLADAVMAAEGIKPQDLGAALEMDSTKSVKALCDNRLDAAIITGIHPIAEIQEGLDDCGVTLLPLKDAAIDAYLKANPDFAKLAIPGDDYQGLNENVPTIGLRAVLVASKSLPDDDAYAIVKAVAGDTGPFSAMHPVLAPLNRKQMAREALVAPLHDGALRYFKENGLP